MIYHILALLLFLFMIGLSYCSLKKKIFNNDLLINLLAIFLISYKAIELFVEVVVLKHYGRYPVEYSTIFYFFFPIVILFRGKILYGSASTGAFISGLGYLITIIFNISNMLEMQIAINNLHGFLIGMLSHCILFYLSILMLARYKFNYKKEVLISNLISIVILTHAEIMANIIDFTEYNLFVYMLNNAEILPFFQNKGIVYTGIYFIIAAAVYNTIVIGFYYLNNYLYNNFQTNEEVLVLKTQNI